MKKRYVTFVILFVFFALPDTPAQDFSRIIQLQQRRMNGPDVSKVQRRLLSLGFKKTGAADGWYGPLTEASVKTIQHYMGFPRDGKVTRAFWNMIFDTKEEGILRDISIINNYAGNSFAETSRRNGSNADFDEWIIGTIKDEVKTVTFRHVNEGLIIFRFKLYYLADAVFIIQDVYYGDYRTRIYLKTAKDMVELKNGGRLQADPALEGILNRVREGIGSAGLKAPSPPIPDFGTNPAVQTPAASAQVPAPPEPAAPAQPAAQTSSSAQTPSAVQTPPVPPSAPVPAPAPVPPVDLAPKIPLTPPGAVTP
ncbi:hypothetical protein AGMMS50230_05070 [Spirochaetia bacterium]|nr:hypothetical protein AGMMS50230_05070 [Spirochaetia bacterium]